MNPGSDQANPTGFWRVFFLLLGTARRRSAGRQKRQQELMRRRSKNPSVNWNGFAVFGGLILTLMIHGAAAYVLSSAVGAGQKIEAERTGKIVVDRWFKTRVDEARPAVIFNPHQTFRDHATDDLYGKKSVVVTEFKTPKLSKPPVAVVKGKNPAEEKLEDSYHDEARFLARENGGTADDIEQKLRAAVSGHGSRDLITSADAQPGISRLAGNHSVPSMLGSLVLLWWAVMLFFQGEGLELDLQRRRHPMWEWLFSHPVPAGAVFAAEMLSPIAANPVYWAAPVFTGAVYGLAYDDVVVGMFAAGLVGIPVAVAAACLGKALEIGVVIRLSPRSRGALLGIASWLGYVTMVLLLLGAAYAHKLAAVAGRVLLPLTSLPWPWLGWFVGRQADGSFSFVAGVLACWTAASVATALAIHFCIWGASRGLSGNYGRAGAVAAGRGARFGKEPLYRKELLWFVRDRSAIVQTILIPLTVAGFQLFNFRFLLEHAASAWNYLSGAAILFGTYFLWILGPKSLASEGSALWLALTWPRGLESLLKAKAWLWSMISTGVVTLILAYGIFLFPADAWKVGLVGVGWLVFGRSMAEKTVTLVTVTSSSGDPEPIPAGRRWAASLGMLTFAIGVLTQQWSLAVVGIVYSYLTAAAMWENFRARLPFLYDPWSEKLPPPPTLMHAMVAISILVESVTVVSAPFAVLGGREAFVVARSIAYTLCAAAVSFGMVDFLGNRGVTLADVWKWRGGGVPAGWAKDWWCGDGSRRGRFARALLAGAVGGGLLGGFALGYTAVLMQFPATAEPIRQARELLDNNPGLKGFYVFCAVGVAPFVEEYLFRGLLYRALDREWGGWRAVLGSAAFFAIYHPPLAWVPVGLLGASNALLFKRTGRLAPAVILHMVYNAVVLL